MNRKILFLAGLFFLLVPLGLRFWETRYQENVISTYWEEVEDLDKKQIETCVKDANIYNAKLRNTFETSNEEYRNLLNLSGNGMMGSLEIPKISLKLPIYHGTEETVLSKGVGHLEGSSLPVGGNSSHCVLTGHRGLPDAQLFTRLDELEEEDVFFIRVCNSVLAYQIREIQVVKPEDVEVTKIQKNEDLVSLITCTPYGLNTHRLVVTGERVEETEIPESSEKAGTLSKVDWILIGIAVVFAGIAIIRGGQNRRKRVKIIKYVPILMLVVLIAIPINSYAAGKGTVEIVFREEEQVKVSYTKVADIKNGTFILLEEYQNSGVNLDETKTAHELEKAANTLADNMKVSSTTLSGKENRIQIPGLEEGVYLFQMHGNVKMAPVLVFIPTWVEAENMMTYDVTVVPKYVPDLTSPDTGWETFETWYLFLLGISFIILLFCLRLCYNKALLGFLGGRE